VQKVVQRITNVKGKMDEEAYLMKITFTPLQESHFPLLLKWLETPHVKAWWDKDIHWTPELIKKRYASYVQGL